MKNFDERSAMHMVYKTRSGFTLIEILVALTIVGIMAAGGFTLFKYVGRAKIKSTESRLGNLKMSISTFQNDTGTYPMALPDLMTRPADQKIAKRWVSPYIEKESELEDAWSRPFVYQINPKGSKQPYELYSWGPNGEGSPAEEQISVWSL